MACIQGVASDGAFLLFVVHNELLLNSVMLGFQVLNEAGAEGEVQLSLSTLLDIVAPLLQQFILEGKAAEESGHDIKQVSCMAHRVRCRA